MRSEAQVIFGVTLGMLLVLALIIPKAIVYYFLFSSILTAVTFYAFQNKSGDKAISKRESDSFYMNGDQVFLLLFICSPVLILYSLSQKDG